MTNSVISYPNINRAAIERYTWRKLGLLRDDETQLRVLIPSKIAGGIIGKGGKNISKLRTNYGITINIPDCPGPERVIQVIADYETALKVLEDVMPSLEEYFRAQRNADNIDLRILLHQSLAGCIIGKGGSKIKELRDKTGGKIKVFPNCAPRSTDRIVSIIGNKNVCVDAAREVIELVKETPIKGYKEMYDPHNYDEDYADEYGGFGSGPQPRVWDAPPRGPMGSRGGGGGGGRGNMGPPPYNDGPRESMGGGNSGPTSTQVTIPKDMAGAIIGKAGQRIRKIRNDSGADITIDEPAPGSNDRIITIAGNSEQIQLAQYLLQQSVLESRGGSRY